MKGAPHTYCTHNEGEPCDCHEQLHTASQSKPRPATSQDDAPPAEDQP